MKELDVHSKLTNEEKTEIQVKKKQEILTLVESVLSMSPNYQYNINSADTSTCPFCYESVDCIDAKMSEIKHSQYCGYLIAKDLSTNLI